MAAFDWNVEASVRRVNPDDMPRHDTDSDTFIKQHKYNHGDVIRLGDHRMTSAQIVNYDVAKDMYKLVANPDESASGYLTIPEPVLRNVTDACTKYHDLIHDRNVGLINFHLAPTDKFIKDLFGTDLPDGWRFNLHFNNGEREEFFVCPPGSQQWQSFDPDSVNWNSIVNFFEARKSQMGKILVNIDLADQNLQDYKEKYGQEGEKYAWIQAKPQLPDGWTVEKVGSYAGGNRHGWKWQAQGPMQDKPEAHHALGQFLQGFQHDFIEN